MFRRLSFLDKIIFTLNLLAAVLVILSFLSQYPDPSKFWFIAVLGLGFPGLVLINLLFIVYWTMKLKVQVFLPLLAALIVSPAIPHHFQLDLNTEEGGLKVSSFNAQVFDHYNWKKDSSKREAIYDFLRKENLDIICFQEYFESRRPYYKRFNDSLQSASGLKYQHKEYAVDFYGNLFGLATFSRYPILETGKVGLPRQGTNICIYSDLLVNSDTVRVYNMHLASLHFDSENYELIENLDEGFEEKNLKALKGMLKRIRGGYKRRTLQAEPISQHIQNSPHPIILCGDFNDGPVSYTYRKISAGLKDSFEEAGLGFGNTYNGKLPALRIDYILHSQDLQTRSHRIYHAELSDHYPVIAELSFK